MRSGSTCCCCVVGVRWRRAATAGEARRARRRRSATRVPIEDEKDDEPEDGVDVHEARRARWSEEAIEAGLAPHTQALTDCYTTKVGKRRWLGGHVVLHWDIKATARSRR